MRSNKGLISCVYWTLTQANWFLRPEVGCGPFEFNTTHVRSLGVAAHLCLASETGPGPVTLEGECWNPTLEMYKNNKELISGINWILTQAN